jgi:hypothetical protein
MTTIKIGDMVREIQWGNIGRVIDIPGGANKYYIVTFDSMKNQYTQEQIDRGMLRVLNRVTP